VLFILAAKAPDAPSSLANNPSKTTAFRVGLTWTEGNYNGGSTVIDYRVSYATANSETFTVYASGLPTTSTIVMGLTPGDTYKFYVQARNIKGFS